MKIRWMKPICSLMGLLLLCWPLLCWPCAAQPPQETAWVKNPANGHFYRLLPQANWQTSSRWAASLGGHLVSIGDEPEQNWVFDTFGKGSKFLLWIGLINNGGKFEWVDGTPLNYTNWFPGEPNYVGHNEQFVAMYYDGSDGPGAWNDWDDRETDPIGLPFQGVVEVEP